MKFLVRMILCLAVINNLFSMVEVDKSSVMHSSDIGKVHLYHSDKGFQISIDDNLYDIKGYWVDPKIRKITTNQLKAFIKYGYIKVAQLDKGEIVLKAYVRGLGGGPVAGLVGYWATKVICYGGAAVGAAVATVYAAPVIAAVAPVVGSAAAAGTAAVGGTTAAATAVGVATTSATTLALGGAGGVIASAATSSFAVAGVVGAGSAAGGIGTAAAALTVAGSVGTTLGTAALVATPGTASIAAAAGGAGALGSVVLAVESLSVNVGFVLGICPFLP